VNSIRINSKSDDLDTLHGYSVLNKRETKSLNNKDIDVVKYIATEGAMLTLIGQVTYDKES